MVHWFPLHSRVSSAARRLVLSIHIFTWQSRANASLIHSIHANSYSLRSRESWSLSFWRLMTCMSSGESDGNCHSISDNVSKNVTNRRSLWRQTLYFSVRRRREEASEQVGGFRFPLKIQWGRGKGFYWSLLLRGLVKVPRANPHSNPALDK